MKARILLVEDNLGDAVLFQEYLKASVGAPFDLLHVTRLREAFHALKGSKIELVLLDLGLPDSKGIDTFLRMQAHSPEIAIILLTGLDDEELALEAVRQGAQDYLVKGQINSDVLRRAIRYAIERKRIDKAEKELAKAKDEFIANISHELRTPIFTIRGFLELLRDGKVTDISAQKDFLMRASHDADRLAFIVDDLIDMYLFEGGRAHLDYDELPIGPLLEEAWHWMHVLGSAKKVEIFYEPPDFLGSMNGDRRRLLRVLLNLAESAIKASEAGGEVRLVGRRTENHLEVQLIDHGPVIPKEVHSQIFDRFYLVDSTSEVARGGSGLGLYLARVIVEAHGGVMSMSSDEGSGTTFAFTLPLKLEQLPELALSQGAQDSVKEEG